MKPIIQCHQNIAENVTRLLLASDIWEMLLQGTRINTRSSLKHPNLSESITIRFKSYIMQTSQQYSGWMFVTKVSMQNGSDLALCGLAGCLGPELSLASHLPHILSISLCQHHCYKITCCRLGPEFPG